MKLLLIFLLSLNAKFVYSQTKLKPGFDIEEYIQLLSLTFHSNSIADSSERIKRQDVYKMEYRSPLVGLLNRWTLYLRNDHVAVIDLRGTVNEPASWLENFYAAMIPATGYLQINDSTRFHYQFAEDKKAAVHVGWTLGLAHLAPGIVEKINTIYKTKNVKEYIIFGHSQGGALAFLLRSYLGYAQKKNMIPGDVIFKTYCSAAPKPGNLYYAYDFDYMTRGGWSHTVVNASDWVPETAFSIQTIDDFNPTNPLVNAKTTIKKQKFVTRLALNHSYNKLDKGSRKAAKRFENFLGKSLYKQVKKFLPQFKEPAYASSNNYMRAGIPIVFMPDDKYKTIYPENIKKPFTHHMFAPYYYLALEYARQTNSLEIKY